jgi:hypothetical protein
MSDADLEQELTSRDHDDVSRSAILGEAVRRIARAKSRPSWIQWATLGLSIATTILAGIAAFPVLSDLGESSWFDF